MSKILVFSIAVNGYQHIFRDNIHSHKAYAKKNHYEYICIEKPNHISNTEAAWLKIYLICMALKHGYDWVMFVDADCKIKPHTPAFTELEEPNKSIYCALGFSGHINSGVIIIKNTYESRFFFNTVKINCERSVPLPDWGENSHMIFYGNYCKNLKIIGKEWNNNSNLNMDDYIRHYCSGTPMRTTMTLSRKGKFYFYKNKLSSKLKKIFSIPVEDNKHNLNSRMESITLYCLAQHHSFQPMNQIPHNQRI